MVMTIMRADPRFTLALIVTLLVASSNAAFAQSWQAEWQKTLAAAKQEGKVAVAGAPGSEYRKALTAFSKSHPDIQLDYVGIQGRDFAPRIMQERRAGQFLWDIHIGGPNTMFNVLLPAKALDPLRPALSLPEVLADKSWRNGFEDGWMDDEAKYAYGFIGYLQYAAYINRDVIPEKEFSKAEDLWHPRWKGKIVWHDPRREGTGTNQGAVILVNFGDDALRRLFKDQGVVLTEDYRQLAEWVVRGRYPIGIGINLPNLQTFQNEGLGKNVKPFKEPKFASAIPGFGTVSLVSRAPHPNAAKVYLNWLLSKEAQSLYAQISGQSSRRLDAHAVDPEVTPEAGVRYLNAQKQKYQETRKKVNEIAKEVFK